MRPQPSEVQGMSSPAEPPPEVRIDLISKDTATDQACQGSRRTMREVHEEGSSQGMTTDTASQDNPKTTREVHAKGSSEGMTTNKAFQDGPCTARAFQEGPDTDREHEEGSPEDEPATVQDLVRWIEQQKKMSKSKAPSIKKIGELKSRHNCWLNLAKSALTRMEANIDASKLLEYLLTSGVVLDAASLGVSEIVDLYLRSFPELLWDINFTIDLIEEIVKGRHVKLFRLVKARDTIRCFHDSKHPKKVSLDALTKWSSRCLSCDVSRAAFLLQRELQWFQVVAHGSGIFKVKFQLNRKSYLEEFVEQRNDLLKEARKWMKDTSASCSLVATLITTVAFAEAFTVPGCNDSNTGILLFLKNGSFMVFAVADALALFCSITATSIFLTILTSRYTINKFRFSLPSRMLLGLTFLFLSLAFMLVAFGSTLTIFLSERWKWSYIPITLLAAFPVVLFILIQLPLYIEMVESTFWPRLYHPSTLWK